MCDFAWIKINGYSYICRISNIDLEKEICDCSLDYGKITGVPFSALQPINGEKLPWESNED